MRVIIIGNGIAGVMTANNLRQLEPDHNKLQINIFAREPFLYYARLRLPEVFGLNKFIHEIQIFKEDWYDKKNITVHYEKCIKEISVNDKKVFLDNGESFQYDKLVLACGAESFIPDIPNNKLYGIFRIREYKDAINLKEHIKINNQNAVVIGGGLLGLETARFMNKVKAVTVVEMYPRLLPRQLDNEGAEILKSIIEDFGIKVILNVKTEEFIGNDKVEGVRLNDSKILKAETVVLSIGIIPRIDIAKKAGLETNRGVVANQYLQSSNPDIYLAGDIVEFDKVVMGIIPAALEHAKIVANNILNNNSIKYTQIIPKTTLKIAGIDLTSIGKVILTEDEEKQYEVIINKDINKKTYFKFVFKGQTLAGCIILGDKTKAKWAEDNTGKIVDKNKLPL